ncbi:TATA box binding protein (TBP)-associated factor, RNA polymerase II, partial [Pseudoloma neurophilia]
MDPSALDKCTLEERRLIKFNYDRVLRNEISVAVFFEEMYRLLGYEKFILLFPQQANRIRNTNYYYNLQPAPPNFSNYQNNFSNQSKNMGTFSQSGYKQMVNTPTLNQLKQKPHTLKQNEILDNYISDSKVGKKKDPILQININNQQTNNQQTNNNQSNNHQSNNHQSNIQQTISKHNQPFDNQSIEFQSTDGQQNYFSDQQRISENQSTLEEDDEKNSSLKSKFPDIMEYAGVNIKEEEYLNNSDSLSDDSLPDDNNIISSLFDIQYFLQFLAIFCKKRKIHINENCYFALFLSLKRKLKDMIEKMDRACAIRVGLFERRSTIDNFEQFGLSDIEKETDQKDDEE